MGAIYRGARQGLAANRIGSVRSLKRLCSALLNYSHSHLSHLLRLLISILLGSQLQATTNRLYRASSQLIIIIYTPLAYYLIQAYFRLYLELNIGSSFLPYSFYSILIPIAILIIQYLLNISLVFSSNLAFSFTIIFTF